MRKITLEVHEYRDFVWMAVNRIPSKDFDEGAKQVAVKKKLQAVGYARELDADGRKRQAEGELVYEDYTTGDAVSVLLEEDEWRWLQDRLKKYFPMLTGYANEHFLTMVDSIAKAEKVDVKPAAEP